MEVVLLSLDLKSLNLLFISLLWSSFSLKRISISFFKSEFGDDKHFDFTKLINGTDFSIAFESLKSAVMESSFGGMLGMFGGEKALEPLKEPFEEKMKTSITQIVHTDAFQKIFTRYIEQW
jgi:hypothetical protein